MNFFDLVATLPALLLIGCAGSPCRPTVGETSITPAIAASGDYGGRQVQWGGVLAEARNLKERTELEVVGYPLDACGRPLLGSPSSGRFLIVRPGYLEIAEFQAGRQITATGTIRGASEGTVGSAPYRFPRLESPNPYLWPNEANAFPSWRPWLNIGIGNWGGSIGGGIGISL
jgi:outer membrane lipoprotein